jgi:hypothetical protein
MKTHEKPEIGVVSITENGGWGASASAPKVKMIMAAYYTKKLGRPILPELVALTAPPQVKPEQVASNNLPRPVPVADRKRPPARQ